jgi:hypothetical protein
MAPAIDNATPQRRLDKSAESLVRSSRINRLGGWV